MSAYVLPVFSANKSRLPGIKNNAIPSRNTILEADIQVPSIHPCLKFRTSGQSKKSESLKGLRHCMYKTNLIISIVLMVMISCSSAKTLPEKRCKSILKNNYSNILVEKFRYTVNEDTLLLTEVKYECVFSAMYIYKAMYDKFGKWNKVVYPKGQPNPILIWENIQLFENDSTEFIVAANRKEEPATIYTSVFVFDNKSRDLLNENSKYKDQLIDYFSGLIRSNKEDKEDFYEVYWKTVNPEAWERILYHRSIRGIKQR